MDGGKAVAAVRGGGGKCNNKSRVWRHHIPITERNGERGRDGRRKQMREKCQGEEGDAHLLSFREGKIFLQLPDPDNSILKVKHREEMGYARCVFRSTED